jgi:DNA-binding protein YbaB
MEQIQARLAVSMVEATSGGGAVKVVAKCDGSFIKKALEIFKGTIVEVRA